MTLLDAYAFVAFLAAEPAGTEVRDLIRGERSAMTSINLAEALDVLGRVDGLELSVLHPTLDALTGDVIEFRAPSEYDAWRAAELRGRYYRRRSSELSLGDCFLLACARDGESIATADPAVAAAARAEGLAVVPLPDRNGRRP